MQHSNPLYTGPVPVEREDVDGGYSDDEHRVSAENIEAEREESLRYKRYLDASRLRSGEAQGLVYSDLPLVSEPVERVDPHQDRRGNEGAMLHHGPSFQRILLSESSRSSEESRGSSDESADAVATVQSPGLIAPGPRGLPDIQEDREQADGVTFDDDRRGQRDTSDVPPTPHLLPGDVPIRVTAVHTYQVDKGDGATTPPGSGTQKRTPFAQANQQGLPSAYSKGSGTSPDPRANGNGQHLSGSHVINMSPRPSERLGRSLSPEDRERMKSNELAREKSPSRRKSTEAVGDGANSSLLGDLAPHEQIVLEFKNVSSWVEVGNYAQSSKQQFKDRFKPKALAGALAKPFKDTATGVVKAGAATGKAVGSQVHSLMRRRKHGDGHDVEMGAPAKKGAHEPANGRPSPQGYRQILYNITGHCRPGQVLALMGPSGSGKTSLLSILGGRAPGKVKLDGQLTVNGKRMSKDVRRRVGFVLQDDVLYETLTVHETLKYAGLLRLPKEMSKAEKMGRVDAVLSVLGLTKSKDTLIGGYFRRGVSGGERKRVSVGHELLINPAVLLLDEPTSGLDSTTALHLVSLLKDLAAGGRSILTTIHQPSSRLYRKLDQVMLLAEGHIMYYGDALHAVDWFDYFGFGLPYGTNLADHILDCAMGEVVHDPNAPGACGKELVRASGRDGKERSMHGATAVRSLYTTFEQWYLAHPEGFSVGHTPGSKAPGMSAASSPRGMSRGSSSAIIHGLLEGTKLSSCTRRSTQASPPSLTAKGDQGPPSTAITTEGQDKAPGNTLSHANAVTGGDQQQSAAVVPGLGEGTGQVSGGAPPGGPVIERGGAAFGTQVMVLWQRALKVRRFESLSMQQLLQLIAVALITGLLWWQRGNASDISGGSDVLGLLFFEMLFVAFRSLFSALFTFPNEFRMLSKERPSGMYKLSAYYIARTAADLPIEILYPSLFIIIVYWFGGLRPDAGAFFANWAAVMVIVLTAQSWGLLIGGLFMDPKMAQTVTTVIMLTFMLVGGFYVRDVPVWIGWLKYLSFVYWGFNLLIKVEFRGRALEACAGTVDGQPCPTFSGAALQSQLSLPTNPELSVWPEVVVLLGMLAFLRWVTYLVLRWKTSSNQRTL